MREVLFLGPIQWDFLWQRPQILASLFHKAGWKTVFLESTGIANPTVKDLFRIALRRYGGIKKLRNPRPQGLRIINPLVMPPTFNFFRFMNRKLFIPRVVEKIKASGLTRPVIMAYPPTETTLKIVNEIPYSLLVYDCADNYEAFPRAAKKIPEWEEELASRARIITTSSPFLYEKLRKRFPDKTFPLYNGVDYSLFTRAFTGIVKKVSRVCFYGSIDQRMNFGLLWGAADLLPQVSFYLVGTLKMTPPSFPENVKFIPAMAPKALVEFLRDCDVLIIPYRKTRWTMGVFPAKFFECLATGKPLIVSGIEENIKEYLDLVYPVASPEQMEEVIRKLPELESEEKVKARIEVARENSWEKRFETLLSLLKGKDF